MKIIGIDPGSDYLGIGILSCENSQVSCLGLHRVRVAGLPYSKILKKLDEILSEPLQEESVVLLEEPPPTARKDTNHGQQTPIGWRLGLISGMIIGQYGHLEQVTFIERKVSDWRKQLFHFASIYGPRIVKPSRKTTQEPSYNGQTSTLKSPLINATKGWIGEYTCGHQVKLLTFQDVQNAPRFCPKCTIDCVKIPPSVLIRDAWKRLSCQVVQAHFPDRYLAVVNEARASARTEKPDEKLAGVADASDALCIALSELYLLSHSETPYSLKKLLTFIK